ncbi:uncharacterized protein AKAME5_000576700 [Lates japonicus]|uniref:Uncharacterized protein n=1 Tax=Lates japonicus TaxID=270547 RepID=A0AAD3MG68_LATJO|nr:uncharacterized protein AKAME5_000576700 [Lates japonicus]
MFVWDVHQRSGAGGKSGGWELKAPRTGVSTEGGEATAANWKWFDAMDEVMGQRPLITPPNLITSSMASTSLLKRAAGARGH